MTPDTLHGWHAIGRQFHHERGALALDNKSAEQFCHDDAEHDANEVHAEENESRILGEESTDDDDIDGQSC